MRGEIISYVPTKIVLLSLLFIKTRVKNNNGSRFD